MNGARGGAMVAERNAGTRTSAGTRTVRSGPGSVLDFNHMFRRLYSIRWCPS